MRWKEPRKVQEEQGAPRTLEATPQGNSGETWLDLHLSVPSARAGSALVQTTSRAAFQA